MVRPDVEYEEAIENYDRLFSHKKAVLENFNEFLGSRYDNNPLIQEGIDFLTKLGISYRLDEFPDGGGYFAPSEYNRDGHRTWCHDGVTKNVLLVPKSEDIEVIKRAFEIYQNREKEQKEFDITRKAMELLSKVA